MRTCAFETLRAWETCPASTQSSFQPVAKIRTAVSLRLPASGRLLNSLAWEKEEYVEEEQRALKGKINSPPCTERKQTMPYLLYLTDCSSFSSSHRPLTRAEEKPKQTTRLLLSLRSKYKTTWESPEIAACHDARPKGTTSPDRGTMRARPV